MICQIDHEFVYSIICFEFFTVALLFFLLMIVLMIYKYKNNSYSLQISNHIKNIMPTY